MNIEINEAVRAQIVKSAVEGVKAALLADVRAAVNTKELADQIRSQLVASIKDEVAGVFHRRLNESDLINQTLRRAEQQFNSRIQKTLTQGVTLRIQLGDGDGA